MTGESFYTFIKLTCGVVATFGLYSVLYKETKFYRFVEHMFLGLAAGYSLTAMWTETLKANWWDKMVGAVAQGEQVASPGYYLWALLVPIGLMAYFVFHKKFNWVSRIPTGLYIGLWAGQQGAAWMQKVMPQLESSMVPIIPNQWSPFTVPANPVPGAVYSSQAIGNIVFVITLISVMSYFIFSIEFKNKFMVNLTMSGRWLMMIGFGAIFGSTVMTRFTLLIDRMFFVWVEWLIQGVGGLFKGG